MTYLPFIIVFSGLFLPMLFWICMTSSEIMMELRGIRRALQDFNERDEDEKRKEKRSKDGATNIFP